MNGIWLNGAAGLISLVNFFVFQLSEETQRQGSFCFYSSLPSMFKTQEIKTVTIVHNAP